MRIESRDGRKIAILGREFDEILTTQEVLDLMVNAGYQGCIGLIAYSENLGEKFFDLKTGFAGEILQKFSNYDMKIGIVGDFNKYSSKSLEDFIFECNNGNRVFFYENEKICAEKMFE